jgi:hypothetical protein
MPILKVDPTQRFPRPYWPKELTQRGYTGEMEALPNACVVVIPKPNAKDKDVAKSLRILAEDFDHRAEIGISEKEDPHISQLELNEDGSVSVREDTKRSKEFGPKKLGKQYVFYDPETKRFLVEPIK